MFVQCICNVVSLCVSVVIHVVRDVCALVNLYVIVCLYGAYAYVSEVCGV